MSSPVLRRMRRAPLRGALAILAALLLPAAPPALAQAPAFLVDDLNPNAAERSSSPGGFVAAGPRVFFAAEEPTTGRELYATDGTAGGTGLVADVHPGRGSAFSPFPPFEIAALGTGVVFAATDGVVGEELWTSDGSASGTLRLADLRPGGAGSSPRGLTAAGARVYFSADDGSSGRELWATDGTGAGTARVKDIRAGSASSQPSALVYAAGRLFFSADDGTTGRELWTSNGTGAGTTLVRDVFAGAPSSLPSGLVAFNGAVYFAADDGVHGRELWTSDGSPAGTFQVLDLNPGAAGSLPAELTVAGGALYFSAFDGARWTLYRSDGTATGTVAVEDVPTGPTGGPPRGLAALDGLLLFTADDPNAGRELYRADGTPAGTGLVLDLWPGAAESFAHGLTRLAPGLALFVANDGALGTALWRTNGTAAGTARVEGILPASGMIQQASATVANGVAYLNATGGGWGYEPWTTDGSAGGSGLLRNLRPDVASSDPTELTPLGTQLLFTAHDGVLAEDDGEAGRELWVSDGSFAGTRRLADARPGPSGSDPIVLGRVGDALLLSAYDAVHGRELWTSDGTESGTALLADIRSGSASGIDAAFRNPTGTAFFAADDGATGRELWRTDGTPAGTRRVADLRPGVASSDPQIFGALGDLLFLSARDPNNVRVLWVSDGTEAGTAFLKDLRPPVEFPPSLGNIAESAVVGGRLFFRAAISGEQLWVSDGTTAGTLQVPGVDPAELTSVNGRLVFRVDGAGGRELWVSDGTAAGSARLVDINPGGGNADSTPNELTVVRGKVFFRADDGTHGTELWLTDGTAAGTRRVRDIRPGAGGSNPAGLHAVNGRLYFAANDGASGEELWVSDGSEAGTQRVADIVPGSGGSGPAELAHAGGLLFFTAEEPGSARELWAVPLPCGDGWLDPDEACDDGGTLDGDGCSASCELEDGFSLVGTAAGGRVVFELEGVELSVPTSAGSPVDEVVEQLAIAVNTDPGLGLAGVWALALGGRLVTNGGVAALDLQDPGLAEAPPASVPSLGPAGALALAVLLGLAAARRARRRAALGLLALVALPDPVAAQSFPVVSPEWEITDASLGQQTLDANNEITNMIQIGRSLYFIYHVSTSGGIPDQRVWVRRFDLDRESFDPPVRVFDVRQQPSYHDEPTLLRDAIGNLHALYSWPAQKQRGVIEDGSFRPLQRTLPDLDRPASWTRPTGLPGRVRNEFYADYCVDPLDPAYGVCGAQTYDTQGVYDERSGTAHLVAEGGSFVGLDGQTDGGLSRMYGRIGPEGRFDGPYMLVEAVGGVRPPTSTSGGNIFTKGSLALGKEPVGPRSLHLVWEIRNTYSELDDPNRPRDEDPASPGYNPMRTLRHNYDIYYARSEDGGLSWRNLANSARRELPPGLDWNDPEFRVVTDELWQGAGQSWALDSGNRPFFVYARHRAGTGSMRFGHVDVGSPGVVYDLVWTRWTGSGWEGGVIEEATDPWVAERTRVRIDREDKIWLFRGPPPRYAVSADSGASWSPWVQVGAQNGWRLGSYADALDPNFHYLVYQSATTRRNYLLRLQLTAPPSP